MNAIKWTLLALVAVLLVYTAIDRRHTQDQLIAIHQALEELRQTGGGQRPATAAPATRPAQPVATDPARDGTPRMGGNFLLPDDRSTYHAEWRRGTLRMFEDTPRRLNMLLDGSDTTDIINSLISDSLCNHPPTQPERWSESLATAVVIGDAWTTYTFTLRPGVRWQRPVIARQPEFAWLDRDVELTADDFVFALDLIMDPTVECPNLRNYYEDLARWEAPDRHTLKLTWKRRVYTSLSFSLGLAPVPRHIYGRNRDGTPIAREKQGIAFNQHWFDEFKTAIGVGAYRIETYEPDKVLRFALNPDYWGTPFHFDAIEWNLAVKKPDPMLIAFKNGQVHYHGLSPLQYKSEILDHNEPRFARPDPADPKAGRTGELGWEKIKRLAFRYLGWNMRRPPFDDKRVRQAMSHAFPKDRILKEVFFGLGQPVLGDVHPDMDSCNRDLKPYAFDLVKAKALLAEAGWSDTDGDGVLDKVVDGQKRPLRFAIKYSANMPEWDNTLMIFQGTLRSIGVEMELKSFEWKELMRAYEDKDFEAVVGGWQMSFELDFYQLWHSSQAEVQGGSNHCGFRNPRVDALAEELRTTFVPAERIRIAKEIQAIIHEEQPYTFFFAAEAIAVWQNHGDAARKELWLDGVGDGFDHSNPLVRSIQRAPLWHFRN